MQWAMDIKMAADESSWRTSAFRQSVVAKIDEAIQRSGMPTTKNSMEMENHVFQKAKSKEEYLGFVARLILHVREMTWIEMKNSEENADRQHAMGTIQGPLIPPSDEVEVHEPQQGCSQRTTEGLTLGSRKRRASFNSQVEKVSQAELRSRRLQDAIAQQREIQKMRLQLEEEKLQHIQRLYEIDLQTQQVELQIAEEKLRLQAEQAEMQKPQVKL